MERIWRDLQAESRVTWRTWFTLLIGAFWTGLALFGLVTGQAPEQWPYLLAGLGLLCGGAADFVPAARRQWMGILRLAATLLGGVALLFLLYTWFG